MSVLVCPPPNPLPKGQGELALHWARVVPDVELVAWPVGVSGSHPSSRDAQYALALTRQTAFTDIAVIRVAGRLGRQVLLLAA